MKKEILAKGKYLQLSKTNGYEFVERVNCTGVVAILALNERNQFIFVEQNRPAIQSNMIELPAGLVGDLPHSTLQMSSQSRFENVSQKVTEDLETAAKRELLEETGYEAQELTNWGNWPTSAGMSSETVTIFFTRSIKKIADGGGDETENIIVHEVFVEEVFLWLQQRAKQMFIDPKVYAALYYFISMEKR